MPDFIWKSGDANPILEDTLTYDDGNFANLEGATVTFQLFSLTTGKQITTDAQAVIAGIDGRVSFAPSTVDTGNLVGNYLASWLVTYPDERPQTFPTDGYMWGRIEPGVLALSQQIVDLASAKDYLNIPSGDRTQDYLLTELIDAVTPLIEAEVGPVVPRTYDEWYDGGSNIITLDHDPFAGFGTSPVLELMAVSEYRGPIEYPLALVPSPAFGRIYSVMLVPSTSTITRRSAAGRSIAFMPGRDSVHVLYRAGQSPVPGNVRRAALESIRSVRRWPLQIGQGSMAPADRAEMMSALSSEAPRLIRMWTKPSRRYPSIA